MTKYFQNKYALSKQGAKDLCKGILYSVLAYVSLMLPVALLACVLDSFLIALSWDSGQGGNILLYTVIGIVILAVIFVMHYLQYTLTYMGTYQESERRRISIAEKLRTMPLRFFHERDLSDLTSTIMGDCAGFEHAFSHTVPQFWGSILSTAIVCIVLLIYDWRMGLALLGVAPVAFAIVLFSRKLQTKQGQKHIDAKLALADGIQECLETVQDIKACNQETVYLKKLDEKMDAAEKAQISSEMVTASLVTTGQMFLRLGLATVIVVGNTLMINHQTTLFSYILFLIAASRLYDPLSGAMANMAELFSVDLQVKRLKEIQDYKEENKKKEYQTDGYDITFDHVSFAYPEAGENVLTDISFKAEKGETIAVIGSTGSGKSTLINLIPRFYDCTQGSIKIDGVDVMEYPKEQLIEKIGVVPQKAVLFSGTIADNIRWGKEDATNEEIEEALSIAQAEDFVQQKDGGIGFMLNQGGKNLSGGQKQRLTIARALVKKPEILILDDSSSALDYATDAALRKAIKEKTDHTTVFLVSQRASSIMYADKIVVLDDGKIAGIGDHDTLMKNCPVYQEIYASQNKEVKADV